MENCKELYRGECSCLPKDSVLVLNHTLGEDDRVMMIQTITDGEIGSVYLSVEQARELAMSILKETDGE